MFYFPKERLLFSLVLSLVLIFLFAACKKEVDKPVPTSPTNTPQEQGLSNITYQPTFTNIDRPANFPIMDIPEDNPLTQEGIELGRRLFFDPILSANNEMACAGCHFPSSAFTDDLAVSTGIDNKAGTRSSMALFNTGYYTKGLFWDGRIVSLEAQALEPVEDPLELNHDWAAVVEDLKTTAPYPNLFRQAFGIDNTKEITKELAVKAIAQFERTIISADSKYDRVVRGEEFFEDDEYNGWFMFFDVGGDLPDAECAHCHNAPLFTVNDYFNNGIDSVADLNSFKDLGLGAVTGRIFDNGKFRAPTLRNIALTAPYMHDGRFQTLEEVINHYNEGVHYVDNVDPLLLQPNGLGLSEQNKKDLLAFLHTLTDTSFVNNPTFQSPF